MILGASVLGGVALGGLAADDTNYVNCEAQISIASDVQCVISIAGRVEIAAAVLITSSIQCALAITGPNYGEVNIQAAIAMASSITAAVEAVQALPDPGVAFTISDKAGGA